MGQLCEVLAGRKWIHCFPYRFLCFLHCEYCNLHGTQMAKRIEAEQQAREACTGLLQRRLETMFQEVENSARLRQSQRNAEVRHVLREGGVQQAIAHPLFAHDMSVLDGVVDHCTTPSSVICAGMLQIVMHRLWSTIAYAAALALAGGEKIMKPRK